MAETKKDKIEYFFDDVVSGTDIKESKIIPNGKKVTLQSFGGSSYGEDFLALQWGSESTWETVRSFYGTLNLHFKKDFVGDGAKRFRLIRYSSGSRRVFVWVEALIHQEVT